MSNIHHDPERLGVDDEWNAGDPVSVGIPLWLTNMFQYPEEG